MMIQIPTRLRQHLHTKETEYSKVFQFIESISGILQAHPNFFPEYTLHGIPHVQMVLKLADQLIPDQTLAKLRPEDICYLICAACIHDIGMFISVDGLSVLLTGKWKNNRSEDLDSCTWVQAWNNYQSEVERFSDEKMLHCFGELIDISNICMEPKQMLRKDYLIIGEFLRRYHPRLAHEIARRGFPGRKTIQLFPKSFDDDDQDIIGLLARSHGLALRDTEKYIIGYMGDDKTPYGCPIFYLMAVLRIADLLDAGKHRAPQVLQDRQAIFIPSSLQEWCWNQKVNASKFSIDSSRDYLSIEGKPKSSSEFILLKNWLENVQQELDMSWSVICEKYSASLQLSIHRIKSTILDPSSKKHRNKFLPKEAKLRANPELLKQLVAPLYNGDLSCGVRELLQNSVDACVERKHLEKNKRCTYKGDVTVSLDTVTKTLTVQDNGIGMDEDVLLNYYLSVGSSYRYSDSWAKDFAPDKKPKIARSGKFGVGVLAAFLLGDKVNVSTRHISDSNGYEFEFGVKPIQLDVVRISRDVGTTVTVHLSDEAVRYLKNDSTKKWCNWYVFDDPTISYFIDNEQYHFRPLIPRYPDDHFPWLKMHSNLYQNYLWTYEHGKGFYCNGIVIPKGVLEQTIGEDQGFAVACPFFSVIDPASHLKIGLARKEIFEIPDEEKLVQEVYRFLLADLLLLRMDDIQAVESNFYEGCMLNDPASIPFLHKDGAFILNQSAFLSAANVHRYNILCYSSNEPNTETPKKLCFLPKDFPFMIVGERLHFHRRRSDDLHMPLKDLLISFVTHSPLNILRFTADSCPINIWISDKTYSHLDNTSQGRQISSILSKTTAIKGDSIFKWHLLNMPLSSVWWEAVIQKEGIASERLYPELSNYIGNKYADFHMPIDESNFNSSELAAAIDCVVIEKACPQDCLLTNILHEYLGHDIWIPYDIEERKTKFPKAFTELTYYMNHIRKDKDNDS